MKTILQLVFSFACGALFVLFLGKSVSMKNSPLVGNNEVQPGERNSASQPDKEQLPHVVFSQNPPLQQDRAADVQKIIARLDQNRRKLLSNLLPSEMFAWRRLREDKVENFLRNTEGFWHNGSGEIQPRFDRAVAESCFGEYEGRLEYQTSDMREPASFSFTLKLAGLIPQEKQNKIALNSEKFGSFSADFSADYLGTDSKSNSLSVLWYNFDGSQTSLASHFAFYIRPNIPVGGTIHEDLYGLTENLQFQRIGSVALKKIR